MYKTSIRVKKKKKQIHVIQPLSKPILFETECMGFNKVHSAHY